MYPLDESEESTSSDEDPMVGKMELENHRKITKIITKNNNLIQKL